jgi:hypothetical protein
MDVQTEIGQVEKMLAGAQVNVKFGVPKVGRESETLVKRIRFLR